jgi:hypothetical protein
MARIIEGEAPLFLSTRAAKQPKVAFFVKSLFD